MKRRKTVVVYNQSENKRVGKIAQEREKLYDDDIFCTHTFIKMRI